jgi:hypothetical protein
MRKQAIIVFLLFISGATFSQDESFHVNLKSGVSFPLGKFHEKSLDGGSFAQLGWSINMEGAWFFHHGMGVGLQAGYHAHMVDVATLASERVKADPFLQELVVRSDPYRVITLAGFVQYYVKIAGKFSVTPSIGAGTALGLSPYQLFKPVYFLVTPRWFEITSTRDWSPYYFAGGNFRYRLNDCLDLLISTEFGYTKLSYRFLTGSGEIRTDIHRVMYLDALAGISFKL